MPARPSRKKAAKHTKTRSGTVTSLRGLLATVRRHDSELSLLRRAVTDSTGRQQEIMDRLDRGDIRFQRIDSHLIETNNHIRGVAAEVASLFDKAIRLVTDEVTTQNLIISGQQRGLAQQLDSIRRILDKMHGLAEVEGSSEPSELVSRPEHIPAPDLKKVDPPGNGR